MPKKLTDTEARANVEKWTGGKFSPTTDYPGSVVPWPGTCLDCGSKISPYYNDLRKKKRHVCGPCSDPKIDDATARANVEKWTGGKFEPLVLYPGYDHPWTGLCSECGNHISPTYGNLSRRKRHCCKYCSGKAVIETEAIQMMITAGVTPLETYPGAKVPWKCRCQSCGKTVTPTYQNVGKGKGGCDPCGNIAKGVTRATPKPGKSLYDLHRSIADEAHGWDPKTVRPYSNQKLPWKCKKCSYEWPATVSARVGMGSGCPECAEHGIRDTKPGHFYVITSDDYVKCGIANAHRTEARLKEHDGDIGPIEVLAKVYFDLTSDARSLEKKWIKYVLSSPYRVGLTREYVHHHDEAVTVALALARSSGLPEAA